MSSLRSLLFLCSYFLFHFSPVTSLYIQKRNDTGSVTYFGVSSAEHEEKATSLKANGFRPLSLSLYGSPSEAKYAAVWVQEEGAAFETIHTADKPTFDSWVQTWKSKGYVSTHVSATGPVESAVYAGVMEARNISTWIQRCEMDSPYGLANSTGGVDLLIKAVSMYGTYANPRYCILGYENTENQQQTVFHQTVNLSNNFAQIFAAETLKRYWRPEFLNIFVDGTIAPIFTDTTVGKWAAEVDLNEAQLASRIKAQEANGLSPINISGGGNPSDIRYAVIFAERTSPLPRNWSASGAVTGFNDNAGVTDALDNVMQSFMQEHGVRQAQVAASINGTVIAERAYTWAEEDRAIVQPDDKFLLASLSKMFTHAATKQLINDGLLNLTTAIYPLLGIQPADKRANNITVLDLIYHTAGYDRLVTPDLGFIFVQVARAKNSSAPATLRDVIDYVAARPLDFTPGTKTVYSNFGTMLLSYTITKLTGIPYHDFIKERVLNGLEAELYETDSAKHVNDAIVQETKFTGINALQPMSNAKVPSVYGGDGAIKEETVGAFALKASATTISRFIGHNAVWGIGLREVFSNRDGSLAGARSFAQSTDKLDWALTLNTREYKSEAQWSKLVFTNVPGVWQRFSIA
ncbi:beta-lactamase/transpeptidase-like protein [Periconia macrospinosa]|uniref:Beta-lactamase/transpeptidase-like protein n=1 Tax=Periconia macrospinosa TaxID=97972 RepID=A0A2V1DDC1_9PLEO|nr:beta-lactamase/transpeptidase-like protein [Periconia macrospinosa]